jgi:methylmalonyl-CoA/ethylmalonyl-CoA epimerase
MVVGNLGMSMDKYIEYGIGPIYALKFISKNVSDMHIHGERKNYSMNIGVGTIGDIRFELIEPISKSIYSEYLDSYGQCIIHHLKLGVDSYKEAMDHLTSIGIEVIQSGHQLGDRGKNIYTYLDARSTLGFIVEIVDVSPDFIKPGPDYWYPENENDIPRPIFKKLTHIGIVVKDLSKKVKLYSKLFGMNCLHIEQFSSDNVSDMHVYGERRDYSVNIAFFNLENINIKLIEPLDDSIFSQFHDRYGEGVIHHLGMEVVDYEKDLEFLNSKGIKVIQSGKYLNKIRFSYLNTNDDINYITEIIEPNTASNNRGKYKP